MSFPFFMPSTSLDPQATPLEDADTRAYRVVLARWLIDLTLMFGGKRRRGIPRFLDNDDFLALTGIAPFEDEDEDEEDDLMARLWEEESDFEDED